jgi:hypothetical protein
METKHTPAPWYVHSTGQHWNNPELENIMICYGKNDEAICDTVYNRDDANLIAAAPELLEALERMILICKVYNGLEAKKARDVVAKAKGENKCPT